MAENFLLLVIREGPGGRQEVASGLPTDREQRLSALYRLADRPRAAPR